MSRTMWRTRFAVVALGAVAFLGACAEDDPSLVAPEATATAEADEGIQAAATVQVAESEDHGEILVDESQRTLYVFLRDTAGTSNCSGDCAVTWPPLTAVGEPTGGDGADGTLDTIEHPDGDTQVTYNDRPLYLYSGDEAAGDANGQGIGGNWFVVGPDGESIED